MVVRLNRRAHILSPTGVYTCVVPGAGGVNITRYISIEMINKCKLFGSKYREVQYEIYRFI